MPESSLCSLDECLTKVRDAERSTVRVGDLEIDDGVAISKFETSQLGS